MSVRKKSASALILIGLFLAHFGDTKAFAQSRGCQFIGASKATTDDITSLSGILLDARGKLEVSMLPFEFNPGNPFGNATAIVQMTTPGLIGSLRITFYLKWFPHDRPGNADQAEFWAAWETSRPNTKQQRIRTNFLRRAQLTDAWIAEVRTWAVQNGIGDKLGVTMVPVLEDACQSRAAYRNVLTMIRQQQEIDGTPTALRRSCLTDSNYVFSLGIPLELHGTWSEVKGTLKSGDTWSNDGDPYQNIDDFVRDQREALKTQVHCLYWSPAYNGEPNFSGARNWPERIVAPFTREGGRRERRNLRQVIND